MPQSDSWDEESDWSKDSNQDTASWDAGVDRGDEANFDADSSGAENTDRTDDDWGDGSEEDDTDTALGAAREYARMHCDDPAPDEGDLYGQSLLAHFIVKKRVDLARMIEALDDSASVFRYRYDRYDRRILPDRIIVLHQALLKAEPMVGEFENARRKLEERYQNSGMSRPAFDDAMRKIGFLENRAATRAELSAMGGSMEEIGELVDQFNHIIEDAILPDGGEMRRLISKKIRDMPRARALEILQNAVRDDIISQETADYLISQYVRPT